MEPTGEQATVKEENPRAAVLERMRSIRKDVQSLGEKGSNDTKVLRRGNTEAMVFSSNEDATVIVQQFSQNENGGDRQFVSSLELTRRDDGDYLDSDVVTSRVPEWQSFEAPSVHKFNYMLRGRQDDPERVLKIDAPPAEFGPNHMKYLDSLTSQAVKDLSP